MHPAYRPGQIILSLTKSLAPQAYLRGHFFVRAWMSAIRPRICRFFAAIGFQIGVQGKSPAQWRSLWSLRNQAKPVRFGSL